MLQPLTRWEYIRAVIARWIVVKIASRVSAMAVLALCLEVSRKYMDEIEAVEE
jgi:hypothetical protein